MVKTKSQDDVGD